MIWRQLLSSPPLCASVGLVLPVLGPSLAHGCYHNAVQVEPGLTQRCRVGLAQTALQHVEKGLTHLLKKKHNWEKQTIFSQLTDMWNCFFIKVAIWNVVPTANDCVLTPTAWCFLPRLSRKSSKEGRSSRWLTAASITSITCTDTCKYTHRESALNRSTNCIVVVVTAVNGAHLGNMFQKLRAGEAVLCGATVCSVVEKSEELRVQLKQSATDKYHTILQVYAHGTGCKTSTQTHNPSINHTSTVLSG